MSEHATEVSKARAMLKKGEYQKVLDLLRPWLAEHTADHSGWEALGAAYYGLKLYDAAEEAARKVTFLTPDSARAWSNLGTMQRKLGQYERARQSQVRAIELDPGYDRARLELDRVRQATEAESSAKSPDFEELS
jgi:tetratricopeptide (TPR) repeat protein